MTNPLYIEYKWQDSDLSGNPGGIFIFTAPAWEFTPGAMYAYDNGLSDNPYASPNPVFTGKASALTYFAGLAATALIGTVNGEGATPAYDSYTLHEVDPGVEDVLLGYVSTSALATTLSGYATTTALSTGLSGKFNTPAGTSSQVVLGNGALGSLPVTGKVYNGTTLRSSPVEYTNSGSTTSGAIVFQLTSDGTSTGTALFSNIDFMKAEVSDATNSYNYSYALSNSNKTLTVTVMRSAPTGVISLLGLNLLSAPSATPNGTVVNIFVKGN